MPSKTEVERRLKSLEARIEWIDQNGTRAAMPIRGQVADQAKDIADIVGKLSMIDEKLDSAARMRLQQYIGLALALLPIYVLLFLTLFHVKPA